MKPYVKVIVNPAAGAGSTKRKWPGIRSCLKNAGLSFDYQFTEGKGHGIELAKAAAGNGFRYLVAVGGDGTIHEVANGILQTPNAAETSLGLISTGTGSDLSRSIGAIRSYSHACSALSNPGKLLIDVGLVEYHQDGQTRQRYFINSAGIGFDAKVIEATESMPKFFGGTIPYLTGLARSFIGYRNRSVTMRIGDKSDEIVTVLGIIAANGKYFGGGMKIAPEARLNDNLLDIIIIGNFGKLELLRVFPRIYKGTHMMYHKVRMERDTRVTIESKQPFLLQADGELLGGGPVSFSIHPAALNLAV
ncbi:MAG: diacylglycerol kinase family lipid kinase [Dehalococcoidales bacterium]|nr:diacylglycerol kinase family lipid kinase [Dehalococcoidales bacterium]